METRVHRERKGVQRAKVGEYSGWVGNHLKKFCREGGRLSKDESCDEGSAVIGAQQRGESILYHISPLFTTEPASGNLFIRLAMRRADT